MKKGTIVLLAVIAVIVILVGSVIGTFNSLARSSEGVDAAYSNIEVLLQRRADLIPNLVNTVKGFMTHEQDVIDSVTEARAKIGSVTTSEDKFAAENELSGALTRLLMVVENYPELKSDQNFIQLADELSGTENRISTARKDYNDVVQAYNTRLRTFPSNIIAGMGGYTAKPYFEAPAGEDLLVPPTVDFGNN